MQADLEAMASMVVDTAYHIHNDLGPGLFETVYETILESELRSRGFRIARQRTIDIEFRGTFIPNAFKADLIIDDMLLLELKSVDNLAAVHTKQLLTYLRLMRLPLGLLINFGAASFKDGIKRVANAQGDFVA